MYMPDELRPYYAESGRRAIFFSKFEASKTSAKLVEPEHLLLGILRENADPLKAIAKHAGISLENIRRAIEGQQPLSGIDPAAEELPFSDATHEILWSAVAGRDPDESATTIEILLAVLRGPDSYARRILESSGVTLALVDTRNE